MDLERMIRSRWSADETLSAILPVERLTVGETSHPVLPFAKLRRRESRPWLRVNTGESFEKIETTIEVRCVSYDATRSVMTAVANALEGVDEGEDSRFTLTREQERIRAEKDGTYVGFVDLIVHSHPTA